MEELVFGYVGVSYKEAPLAVRERVSFTDSKKIEFMKEIQKIGVEQCMVLSTCNRSEIFFFCDGKIENIRSCYEEAFSGVDISKYMLEKQGNEAYEYLFRITAGLESLVLGEDQILGQVVDTLEFSRTMGHAGKELNKIVREAITCAKRIKTKYKISEKPLSVSYVGIQQLQKLSAISGKTALVVGSGKTAMLALTYLKEYGIGEIYLCNRTFSHAKALEHQFSDIQVTDYGERYEVMKKCDLVISATASPHVIITREKFQGSIGDDKEMIFLDLASPRDVDPELENQENVILINLDSLQKITEENQKERERLARECKGEIDQSILELMEWLRTSQMDSTIESIQKRCSDIVEDSFSYLNRKLDLSNKEQKILKKVLHANLQRLFREPIKELKELDTKEQQENYKKMIQHLFQMESEDI